MQSTKIIIELGNKLPIGTKKRIAEKTGLTAKTVVDFFKGKKRPKMATYNAIMEAAIQIVTEMKSREDALNELVK